MKDFFNRVRAGMLLDAVLTIAMGVCFCVVPEETMTTLFKVAGVLFLVDGVFNIVEYFSAEADAQHLRGNLYGAAIKLSGALLFLIHSEEMVGVSGYIFSVVLMVNGIASVQISTELKRLEASGWVVHCIVAVVTIAFGVLLAVNPFATARAMFVAIAASLLLDGCNELIAGIRLKLARRKLEKLAQCAHKQ